MNSNRSFATTHNQNSELIGVIIHPQDGKELGKVLVNNRLSAINALNNNTVMGQMTLVGGDIRRLRKAWFHHDALLMNIGNKQVTVRIAGMPKELGDKGILEISRSQ